METDITRNTDLDGLVALLRKQHTRKVDVVAPATSIASVNGNLVITNSEAVLTDDGVTNADGVYRPNAVAVEGISAKLGIPLAYTRRLHEERTDLFDENVNGWLHGGTADDLTAYGPDTRSFLVRAFAGDDGTGMARAFLSDRYAVMDNLDCLMSALSGIEQAGVDVQIAGCDLSDRRMYVRVIAPEVRALAPTLLRGYTSPFTGEKGADNPTVFAGFVLSNSEVGNGAYTITPRIVVQVCSNGMTITKDLVRAVHLGGRLEEGTVRWSAETEERNLSLIKAKTRDAVATFLDADYVAKVVEGIEERAGKPVEHHDEVTKVTKALQFTTDQQEAILQHFSKAGQWTAGGVMAAVTSAAQQFDADDASDMEDRALAVLSAV